MEASVIKPNLEEISMEASVIKPSILAGLDLVNPAWAAPKERRRVAPRLESLAGKRAGFLDNRKDNADIILKRVAARLEKDYGTASALYRTKIVHSRRAEPAMLDELAANCDFVVTSTGA